LVVRLSHLLVSIVSVSCAISPDFAANKKTQMRLCARILVAATILVRNRKSEKRKDLVSPAKRGRREGAIVAVFAVCSTTGPVIGGVITGLLSWHWIFYINLPLGALSLAAIGRVLHQRQPLRSRRIDYVGALLLTPSRRRPFWCCSP
jgi:MFS family permease